MAGQKMSKEEPADTFLADFESVFGLPESATAFTDEQIANLESVVCDVHFRLLKQYGIAVFAGGLVRLINPLDWQQLTSKCLNEVPIFSKGNFVPVLIGSFGQIDMIDLETGIFLKYRLFENQVLFFQDDISAGKQVGAGEVLRENLLASDPEDYDLVDDDGNSIYQQLSQSLGDLEASEVFALTPETGPEQTPDLEIEKADFMEFLETMDERPQLIAL
jgi:hypothetical protein